MSQSIVRGDIYWVNLDPTVGSETKKKRPALIISNNIQNKLKRRFVIAPITSSCDKIYPFEVLITLNGQKGKVMLDQIRTVDNIRLDSYITNLSDHEMMHVDKAIKLVLAL
ncbi:plasmid maintenance protein [endosymbiont of Acanthamoeba sp. UWC8]|uniref:type II toxin-antitoxin system PemK/MazF family toxin n=1 Tax=endosymbiont of Acanthamoeba sp. UWC8 TaxID=86106 RepID=UPI0004D0FC84|nr:type II toxin-antitoxin system PemK/MazF family toxin [endosymbiont of Acanthamoeba sp. UWC8]AIF82028.1 plasmid maintenance protein [endosymbiont of Acanthamoeba sp. UWC8]